MRGLLLRVRGHPTASTHPAGHRGVKEEKKRTLFAASATDDKSEKNVYLKSHNVRTLVFM